MKKEKNVQTSRVNCDDRRSNWLDIRDMREDAILDSICTKFLRSTVRGLSENDAGPAGVSAVCTYEVVILDHKHKNLDTGPKFG